LPFSGGVVFQGGVVLADKFGSSLFLQHSIPKKTTEGEVKLGTSRL